jgi:Domain of Unknown Function with PDB structure (DUF3857)
MLKKSIIFMSSIYFWRHLSCAWLLAIPFVLSAQSYSILAIPDSLLDNAQAVVRRHDMEVRVKNVEEVEITTVFVVTILKESGNIYAQHTEHESPFFKIRKMEARLYDAAGQLLRESNKKDIQVHSSEGGSSYEFSDSQLRSLDMAYSQFPYTVEFSIVTAVKSFFRIPGMVVQRLGQSVQQTSFTLLTPTDYRFRHKLTNADIAPVMGSSDKEKSWRWNFQNLRAKPLETHHQYLRNAYTELIIAPEQVAIDGHPGRFSNWQEVGRFFYELNKGRDHLTPQMQATVQALIRQAVTPRDKIGALYRYLQQNHRYISIQIGIGGWQTFDAAFVEQKKYGDCKALSNYMQALLKAADIEAWQALVFGGTQGAPACYEDTPTPRFNHVILYVPGEDLWLECTSNEAPVGYLGDFTAGHPVLLLTPTGGRLTRTPALQATDNAERKHLTLNLDAAGGGQLRYRALLTGEQQETYRSSSKNEQPAEVEKRFLTGLSVPAAALHTLRIAPDSLRPVTDLYADLTMSSYSTRSGKRLFVPLTKADPVRPSLPADEHRTLDLHIARCYTTLDTMILHLPAGYRPESVPSSKKMETAFGSYELSVQVQENTLTVIRHAVLHPVEVPAARYNEVRQFYTDLSKADAAQLVLVKVE